MDDYRLIRGLIDAAILFLSLLLSATAKGEQVDFLNGTITTTPNSIIATTSDDVLVVAFGYQVEITPEPIVWGPFPTAPGIGGQQIFGVETSGTRSGIGLMAQPVGPLNPSENDRGSANFQPTLDNIPRSGEYPEIQIVLFTFSEPVDITQIVADASVDQASLWVASGQGEIPDLTTMNFLDLLNDLGVEESVDDQSGPIFVHNISSVVGADYMLVGTAPRDDDFGPLTAQGNVRFFIDAIEVIPTPSSALMLATATLFTSVRRTRS